MYNAKILLDSISLEGNRLTTFELTYPRFVHSEFMTHRVFSRNSSSSRAIPIEKMIERVMSDPAMPVYWGRNQKGMQAAEELSGESKENAIYSWLCARDNAVQSAWIMLSHGTHKQIVNRLLEPWMWITVICSATQYGNFFNLRCHKDAQPEIKHIADMMRDLYYANKPKTVGYGEWHLPLVLGNDYDDLMSEYKEEDIRKISVGRCARVSYLTHDGKRDPQKDIELCDRLVTSGHWSPFEHVATPLYPDRGHSKETYYDDENQQGNFVGWVQYRKLFDNENREVYFK